MELGELTRAFIEGFECSAIAGGREYRLRLGVFEHKEGPRHVVPLNPFGGGAGEQSLACASEQIVELGAHPIDSLVEVTHGTALSEPRRVSDWRLVLRAPAPVRAF